MMEYLQWLIFIVLNVVIDNKIRAQKLRKYVGLSLLATGLACAIWLPYWAHEAQLPSVPIGAVLLGSGLFLDRHRYSRTKSAHPLLVAPTPNLAADFPDDPSCAIFCNSYMKLWACPSTRPLTSIPQSTTTSAVAVARPDD